jgi:hypothetical protein
VGRSKARRQRDREQKAAAKAIVTKVLAVKKEKDHGRNSDASRTGSTG